MRRTLLVVAGWAVTAAGAAGVGVLALSLLGAGITGGPVHVLSEDEASVALSSPARTPSAVTTTSPSAPRPSPSSSSASSTTRPKPSSSTSKPNPPSTSPSRPNTPPSKPQPPSTPATSTRSLGSAGGTVVARCTGDQAYLVSWTSRQGFEIDDAVRGPGPTAYVQFESEVLTVDMTITCRDGVPVAATSSESDD